MREKKFDPGRPVIVSVPDPSNPGPTSMTGKAISSKNALRHGCCADSTLILKSENLDHFKTLENTWVKSYNPKEDAERHLIQELVLADWLLQRSTRALAEVEAQLTEENSNPLNWTEQQQRTFGRFLRYQTARSNTVKRCIKVVEDYRKNRNSEKIATEKLTTAEVRRKALEHKNKPEPTWKEHLIGMRQKAIALGFTPPDLK